MTGQDKPAQWRTGRRVGRTLYLQTDREPGDSDLLIGMMDTPELAAGVANAVNLMNAMFAFACPTCPYCGRPPEWLFKGGGQAFCYNEDCQVIGWNPSVSAAENLADMPTVLVDPDHAGGPVMTVHFDHGVDRIPQDDGAVPPVPADADLPIVELDPGRDGADPGNS